MADIQIIPKDWQKPLENLIATMQAANESALRHPPGAEHDRLWDVYEGACHDFLDHIDTHFGSVQAFSDFLRSDVRSKIAASGLSTDIVDEDDSWGIDDFKNSLTAGQASAIYRVKYNDLIEGLAFNRAFHHDNAPRFDLT